MPNFSASQLILGMVFGSVGFVVFIYGKKQALWKPMAAGAVLMGLPYLIEKTAILFAGGALVLAALYIFRD